MKLTKPILLTGLLVGTLDGIAAIIHFKLSGGGNPLFIAKYIASGVFGPGALNGGAGMIISGGLFHYIIAIFWTALFFLIYPRVSGVRLKKYVPGVLYGVLIWLVMNLIVLPLTCVPLASRDLFQDAIGITILIVTVGLPISLIQQREALKC
jgi:hypothetical protein